eukprot:TRINITY_DN16997_c0_g1_i1.p1 TRINITY_DN16997_c0_g1~~TRINITY_DN16997_c0_g1_i1.p1  ORF type:complete len:386 (-),score=90.51 TRINITY_DN16997_c0_g1_i1:92-1225(-)
MQQQWGTTSGGEAVQLVTLRNATGWRAEVLTYGATLARLVAPDADDLVLGLRDLRAYERENEPYLGAVVGRVGNRIANGTFTLNGKLYKLVTNNNSGGIPCHLHGGTRGFDKRCWEIVERGAEGRDVKLHLHSPDGEEGYPGALDVWVTYSLAPSCGLLRVHYEATVQGSPTPVNLTNHSYFNLAGEASGTAVLPTHTLLVRASYFTPVDKGMIPTGEIRPVAGSPFDFCSAAHTMAELAAKYPTCPQLAAANGYDHNFVLDHPADEAALLRAECRDALPQLPAISVKESTTGRELHVWTTQPGVQVYAGNFLDVPAAITKSGRSYGAHTGLALETQHFPDSVNHPNFPSTILNPGERFSSTTVFLFEQPQVTAVKQ